MLELQSNPNLEGSQPLTSTEYFDTNLGRRSSHIKSFVGASNLNLWEVATHQVYLP